MSDLEKFFLVLAAIYLAECLVWIRRDALAFRSLWGKQCRLTPASLLVGNRSGGLLLANPLPPLGTVYVCQSYPVSISPDGIYSYVAETVNPGERPDQPARYVSFEEIDSITVSQKDVLVNGRGFVKVASTEFARHLCDLLRRLRKLPTADRGEAIEAALAESMDFERIAKRVDDYRSRVRTLRLLCNAMFVFVLGVSALLMWMKGIPLYCLPLLLGFPLGLMLIGIGYYRAHSALYPHSLGERLSHLAMIILLPPAAIRAADIISRDLLSGFHPLAVSRVVCSRQTFLAFARRILCDARFPILPVCPTEDEAPRETERWFRTKLGRILNDLVKREGIDPEELTAPPRPDGWDARSYCPRCDAEYILREGECLSCGGIPLRIFERDGDGQCTEIQPSTLER